MTAIRGAALKVLKALTNILKTHDPSALVVFLECLNSRSHEIEIDAG